VGTLTGKALTSLPRNQSARPSLGSRRAGRCSHRHRNPRFLERLYRPPGLQLDGAI